MKCFKCEKEVNDIYPVIDTFQKIRFSLCSKCIAPLKKKYNNKIATCIGCGCDDLHACWDKTTGACFWLAVDYSIGFGVCSSCPDYLKQWEIDGRKIESIKEGME